MTRAETLVEQLGGDFLRPSAILVRGLLELYGGDLARGEELVGAAFESCGDALLATLDCAQMAVVAAEDVPGNSVLTQAVAALDGSSESSPPYDCWARYARGLLAHRRDDDEVARDLAHDALTQAEPLGERRLVWRALLLESAATRRLGESEQAAALRAQARELVEELATSLDDEALRRSFMQRPAVRRLFDESADTLHP